MKRIMFVCHGNICRSPAAQLIFQKLARDRGVGDRYFVASSATSTEEIYGGIGNPVYPPMRKVLGEHGIDCKGKRAVQLSFSDGDKHDIFIGMDDANIRNMHRMLPEAAHKKIYKLMSFCGESADVSDPWYSGRFETAYNDILRGCTALLEFLERE